MTEKQLQTRTWQNEDFYWHLKFINEERIFVCLFVFVVVFLFAYFVFLFYFILFFHKLEKIILLKGKTY